MIQNTLVISGGTKGLGREISLIFAEKGHRVIALYSKDTNAAKLLEKDSRYFKGQIISEKYDITKLKSINEPLEFEKKIIGKMILINNAVSTFQPKPMHITTREEIQNQWEVTVLGTFFLSICCAKRMIKDNSGIIANVLTPLIEEDNVKGFSAYLMAKHALLGMTKVQASEFGRLGIRVISLFPPLMRTDLTKNWNQIFLDKLKNTEVKLPNFIASRIYDVIFGIKPEDCVGKYVL